MSADAAQGLDAGSFIALVRENPINAVILDRLPRLDLPDCWLVAGCLVQTVWNVLSVKPPASEYESRFGVPCAPLVSSRDGIDHFLNRSSCFGIEVSRCAPGVYAPFGYGDLERLMVRPNRRRALPSVYEDKAARWRRAWPALTVIPWEVGLAPAG